MFVLLSAALILTSCSRLVQFRFKDGMYIDTKTGTRYYNASVSYEPVSQGDEYAQFNKTTLYMLPGTEPEKWLAEKYEGIGSVFYAEDVELPSLSEFEASKILIFVSGYNSLPLASVDDPEVISVLIDILENGDQTEAKNTVNSYSLKLMSDKYPFICYNLIYIMGSDGQRYVYDRGTKRTVSAGTLLDQYFTGETVPFETAQTE